MDEATFCEACKHVFKANKTDPPWRWLCIKHPRIGGHGHVVRGLWTNAEPYLRCSDVNGGACPLYEFGVPFQPKESVDGH